jgi:hypothetical protein
MSNDPADNARIMGYIREVHSWCFFLLDHSRIVMLYRLRAGTASDFSEALQ